MANERSNAENHAKKAKDIHLSASRTAKTDQHKLDAAYHESTLNALLAIYHELRHANDIRGSHTAALNKNTEQLEENSKALRRTDR